MKNLTLLIIFSVLTVGGDGQNIEYGMKYLLDLTTGSSSTPLGGQMSTYDTIPVLMLVSDTAHRIYTYLKFVKDPDTTKPDTVQFHNGYWAFRGYNKEVKEDEGQYNFNVWRMNGFEVLRANGVHAKNIEPDEDGSIPAIYIPETTWEHFAWLDEHKKPLSKSIIVWMKKEK